MNKEESKAKTKLVKEAKKEGMYARRIEDQYGVGILDMVFVPKAIPKVVFFAEGKLVDNGNFKPTPRQWVEITRVRDANPAAVPCLIGFDGDEMYLHVAAERATIDGSVKRLADDTVTRWFTRFYERKIRV